MKIVHIVFKALDQIIPVYTIDSVWSKKKYATDRAKELRTNDALPFLTKIKKMNVDC